MPEITVTLPTAEPEPEPTPVIVVVPTSTPSEHEQWNLQIRTQLTTLCEQVTTLQTDFQTLLESRNVPEGPQLPEEPREPEPELEPLINVIPIPEPTAPTETPQNESRPFRFL